MIKVRGSTRREKGNHHVHMLICHIISIKMRKYNELSLHAISKSFYLVWHLRFGEPKSISNKLL